VILICSFAAGHCLGSVTDLPPPNVWLNTGVAGAAAAVPAAAVRRQPNTLIPPQSWDQCVFPIKTGGESIIRQVSIGRAMRTMEQHVEGTMNSPPASACELSIWATKLAATANITEVNASFLDGQSVELEGSFTFGADCEVPTEIEVPRWAQGVMVLASYKVEEFLVQLNLAGMRNRGRLPYWQCPVSLVLDVR